MADEKKETASSDESEALLMRAKVKFSKSGHLMQAFLDEYERTENQTLAAKNVGISHDTPSAWKKNEDFLKLFTMAHLRAVRKNNDNLKGSAMQRAVNGSPHFLIRNGQIVRDERNEPVVAYRDFETQLTMFMLKNRMPDEFKDKFEHEINGQLIITIATEFVAIVRKHCPPEISNQIEKELETLSAKLSPV